VQACRGFPAFQPLAMLGGFLWCTGNILTVPIVKCIGLSLGMLTWGLSNLIVGWASGAFGLFGLKRDTVNVPWLNYVGAALAVCSVAIYVFIKPNVEKSPGADSINEEGAPLTDYNDNRSDQDWIHRLGPQRRRFAGFGLALLAGILYGTNFNPPKYIMDHCTSCSQNGLDYVFSHFSGIFLTSTFYMVAYSVFMNNKPKLYPEAVFPGFLSGLMWGMADVCWFIANSALAFVVAFPIITVLPSVVATIWGVVVFKEIRGKNNFLLLGIAFTVTLTAVVCTALSKELKA